MQRLVTVFLVLVCTATILLTSCNRSTPTALQTSPAASPARRYHLKGRVVSVDKQSSMLNVDSEAIPDFMGAMTMPYQVKPESELNKLSPGDAITADVVVQDDKAWLENIAVTNHSAAPASK